MHHARDIPSASPPRAHDDYGRGELHVGQPHGVGSPNRYRRGLADDEATEEGPSSAPAMRRSPLSLASPGVPSSVVDKWGVKPAVKPAAAVSPSPTSSPTRPQAPSSPRYEVPSSADGGASNAPTSTAAYMYARRQQERPEWLLKATGYAPPPLQGSQRVDVGPAAVARSLLLRERCSIDAVLPQDEEEARKVLRELATGGADVSGNASNPDPLKTVFRAMEDWRAVDDASAVSPHSAPPLDDAVSTVFQGQRRRSGSPAGDGRGERSPDDTTRNAVAVAQRAAASPDEKRAWNDRITALSWLNERAADHPTFDPAMLHYASSVAGGPTSVADGNGQQRRASQSPLGSVHDGHADPRARFVPSASIARPPMEDTPFPRRSGTPGEAGAGGTPSPQPEWLRRTTVPFDVQRQREREALHRARHSGGTALDSYNELQEGDAARQGDDASGASMQPGAAIDRHRLVKLHDSQVMPPPPSVYTYQTTTDGPPPLPFDRPKSSSSKAASPIASGGGDGGVGGGSGGHIQLSHRPLKPHQKRENMFVELNPSRPGADIIRRLHPSLDGRVDAEKMSAWIRSTTTTAAFGAVGHGTPGHEVHGMGYGRDAVTPHKVQHAKLAESPSAARRVTWDLARE